MRLSSEIVTALLRTIESKKMPGVGSELFLFGSRTDPGKKGGDIDLLLIVDASTQEQWNNLKLELRSVLRQAAGDQKVDLSIITPHQRATDAFFSSLENLISLKKW